MRRTTAVAAGAAVIAAIALIAGAISPWYEVASRPVQLTTLAAVDAIDLCWTSDGCERFVRKPDSPDVWLAELPPQQRYDVRLRFPNGTRATKARIVIFDTSKVPDPGSHEAAVPALEQSLDIPELAPGADVTVGTILAPSRLSNAAVLFGVLLAICAGLVLGARSLAKPTFIPLAPAASIHSIVLFALAATTVHALLVGSLPILYYLGTDSDDYLVHALNLVDHFHYRVPGRDAFSETVRTPGYAALLAGIFLAFGKHLSTVILVQSILFMAAVSCLALALRRWVPAALLGALLAIAAIMPPNIEMSRGIQSDGPAATFALFSVAAFIEAGCRSDRSQRSMIWIGAPAAALAIMVRPTAVAVLVIPALMALQRFVIAWPKTRWQSAGIAMPVLWIAVAPAIAALAAWSSYNWFQFKYLGPSNFGPTIRFTGRMDTGVFDLRSLHDREPLRQAYLIGREATGYWEYHVHFVAPMFFVKNQRRYVAEVNAGLSDVISRSDKLNPWPLTAVRLLRGVWWGALLPPTRNYNGYLLPFQVLNAGNVSADAVARTFPGVILDSPQPAELAARYAQWGANIYNAVRPAIYLSALLAAIWLLFARGWLLAAPMLVHTANMLLHAGLGVVYARYVQGLDILLFAQVAIGLAVARFPQRETPAVAPPDTATEFHGRTSFRDIAPDRVRRAMPSATIAKVLLRRGIRQCAFLPGRAC
jgi:hypothetical protein